MGKLPPSVQQRHGHSVGKLAHRPSVLLVDDSPANLIALKAILYDKDIEVISASSGRMALEILFEQRVALALIDVQMPEMNGFELAARMRRAERTRDIPIIFVTAGSHDQGRVFEGYEAGAVDYMFKPIDRHVLRSKVDVFVTLEEHRRRLEEADRMRELFIAALGHDLGNPLGAIMMTADLLQQSEPDEELGRHLKRIISSAERMSRLVDQLLDTTRFRHDGQVVLAPRRADIGMLARQIVEEFEQEQGCLHLNLSGDLVGTWDQDRIQQVLSNLIGNAIGHSPAGSPVRVHIDGSKRATVALQITNGGDPIPVEERSSLFEPFRRGPAGGQQHQGLGLGLFITQQLVQAHAGTISFESDETAGTCFTVQLPRHLPDLVSDGATLVASR